MNVWSKDKKPIAIIDKAVYVGNYSIEFSFSDGVVRVIDFKPFLESARNPMVTKYLDVQLFRGFYIHYGDIVWNDYEMCFPIWDLHEGKI